MQFNKDLMSMSKSRNLLILLLLTTCSLSLHLTHTSPEVQHKNQFHSTSQQQTQLDYLIGLQKNYSSSIQALNNEASATRNTLTETASNQDRIKILQAAITKERSRINKISSNLIPDSTSSAMDCQILPLSKQQSLTNQKNDIQDQIKAIQNEIASLPQCDQTAAMKIQLTKLQNSLQRVSIVANNQCQQNLVKASAVFQTNLYQNQNWVLGTYTMDNLINQFYQNSLKYGNISNCPLERPFMPSPTLSTSGNSCIRCPDSQPYFDVSSKKCIACYDQQSLDLNTRKCGYPKRNSNYTAGPNYRLQPLSEIPAPQVNSTSCPASAPFFNGTICVQCPRPTNYWQISQSKCYPCPNNQVFSINLRKCLNPLTKKLTVLNNTNWVSNNTNKVYTEREQILQANKTSGEYSLCNDTNPYFDNTECISCEHQFNVDNLSCVFAQGQTAYSQNLRKYVTKQNKQTDPKAKNYISSQNLTDDPSVPNCNSSYPFFDGNSCVYCRDPLPIFDVDRKVCTICPSTTTYSNNAHQCIPKPLLYVYGSTDRLLATQQTSIKDYNNTLQKAIQNNPDKVAATCPQKQYAAITKCIKCDPDSNLYFNVQTLSCASCDGVPDRKTHLCVLRKYYFINTNAQNILVPQNTTLQQISGNNNATINSNPSRYELCPLSKPYPYQNKTVCGKCPTNAPLYSIQLQACTYCPEGQAYDNSIKICRNVLYLTNYDRNVVIDDPLTLNQLLQEQQQLNKTNFTMKCPQNAPYTPDNHLCFECLSAAPLYSINKGICIICPYPLTYSFTLKKCTQTYYLTNLTSPRILQSDSNTVQSAKQQQIQLKQQNINYQQCPINRPYGQASGCIDCTGLYNVFSLDLLQCVKCQDGSGYWENTRRCVQYGYLTNFNGTQQIVQNQGKTLSNYKSEQEQKRLVMPTQVCPQDSPFSIGNLCQKCPQSAPFFRLSDQQCITCPNYNVSSFTCPAIPIRYSNLTNYNWFISQSTADDYINKMLQLKQQATGPACPQFYNQVTKQCVMCGQGELYNFDNKQCEQCPNGYTFDVNLHKCVQPLQTGTYFTNVQSTPSNLQIYGGLTLDQLQTTSNSQKGRYPNSQYCPQDAPFFDGINCISCPKYKQYFNLRYLLCQVCLQNQSLGNNDCYDSSGNKVWRQPTVDLIYGSLFGYQ